MTKLSWNEPGSRHFEAGVDRGVLYLDDVSLSWNGLISVTETPSETEIKPRYLDGTKFTETIGKTSFSAGIKAYTYPEEFENYIGFSDSSGASISNQPVQPFGMSYRTKIGNDLEDLNFGYKIHLVYNATADLLVENNTSLSTSTSPMTFSFTLDTTPMSIPGFRPSAHLIIDTRYAYAWAVQAFEDIIYGTELEAARLPTPQEVFDIFEEQSILRIVDHGDGTWSAIERPGFENIIEMLSPILFQIDWPSAVYIDSDSFQIQSL